MKKKITLLSHHLGLQGSNLNMLDMNRFLQLDGYHVKYYTINPEDLYRVTRDSKRLHIFDELINLNDYVPVKDEIIFTDFKTLIKLFHLNINLECKELYIMDNNELSYHLNDDVEAKFYHPNVNVKRFIKNHKYEKIKFLFPESNEEKFKEKYPEIPYEIWHKKISWDLLKQIKFNEKDVLFYRFDDENKRHEMEEKYGDKLQTFDEYDEIDLWDYKGMIYYRRKHLNYYEQLGRLVFEFIMLGKEVHFLKDPFEVNDGLSDYLRFYDIRFDDKYTITTTADELIKKMSTPYTFLG